VAASGRKPLNGQAVAAVQAIRMASSASLIDLLKWRLDRDFHRNQDSSQT